MRRGQITDAPMQMKPELPQQHIVGRAQSVLLTPFLENRKIDLLGVAAKNLPGHLHVAVGRDFDRRRRRGLPERQAESPATEDVPLRDSGLCLDGRA
jgi:hypothetical protein